MSEPVSISDVLGVDTYSRSAVIQTPLCLFGLSFRQEPGRATLLAASRPVVIAGIV